VVGGYDDRDQKWEDDTIGLLKRKKCLEDTTNDEND